MQNTFHQISCTNQLNEMFYEYMYNTSNGAILVISNQKICFANLLFQKITGYDFKDLNERKLEDIVPVYSRNIVLKILDNIEKENDVRYIPFLTSNNDEIHLDVNGKVYYNEGVEYTILNLTAPLKNNQLVIDLDHDLYHSILNSVSENILIIDEGYNVSQTIKIKSDKFSNINNLSEIFSTPALKQFNKVFNKKWKGDEVKFFEIQNYKSYYESRLVKYKGGLYVYSFSEISLRKRIEHKLIDSQIQLGLLNQEKDLLLSIIAHDLKNPFNVIKGFCSVLLKTGNNIDQKKKDEIIEHIYTASMSGYSLLETLLEWSRSQTNRIMFSQEKLNLKEICNHIITYFSIDLSNKSIHAKNNIQENLFVFADKNMLSTILRNLISNAIKYTGQHGEIKINSFPGPDGQVTVLINDTGIGMTEKQMEDLFKIGSVYSTKGTGGEKGTGLGLLLCKEFVEKHDGTISVTSEKNQGTEFKFTLPVPAK